MNIELHVNRRVKRGFWLGLFLFFAGALTAAAGDDGTKLCYRQVDGGLQQLKKQLPAMTRSAELAADLYVNHDFGIAAFGDPGLVMEATGRAGGLMPLRGGNLKTADGKKTVALFFPYRPELAAELAAAAKMRKNGAMIIVFGDAGVKEATEKAGLDLNNFMPTGAANSLAFPVDAVLNMAALWCWTGEFVAACTRLGKMPPLYQSYSVPGSRERAAKFNGLKFHAGTPQPIPPGTLGTQYLDDLMRRLAVLNKEESEHIAAAARLAREAIAAGHAVYWSGIGHALVGHARRIAATGRIQVLNDGWNPLNPKLQLRPGDLVLFIGYDDPSAAPADAVKKAGAELVWSLTDYKMKSNAIPAGQIFINQRWELGDAVVTVPGYDIRILPPSGILAETILGMILADLDAPRQ